jgi:hypothetical protein
METFWTIMAYAFVLGIGALMSFVFLLWLRAADAAASRRPSRPAPESEAPPRAPVTTGS